MHDNPRFQLPWGSGAHARFVAAAAVGFLAPGVSACGSEATDSVKETGSSSATSILEPSEDGGAAADLFPDVVDVELTEVGGGRYTVSATLSSPYDSPDRYADAWRVLDTDGRELGVRELAHDHAGEQPFTRSTTIEIPADVGEVTVQGRDQRSGYGGATVTVEVPRLSD